MNPSRILIVEDEALIAADLEDRLVRFGYTVVDIVDTGVDAIQQAMALRPDLILMDIRLRGPMDGIQAAEQIRTCTQIPVVFLTAHADRDTLQRAGRTEPFGYLVKPFEERNLHACLAIALYRRQIETRLRTEAKRQETQKHESLGVLAGGIAHDFNNLLTAIMGNAELCQFDLPPSSVAQEYLQEIMASSTRATDLCQQMLAYTGQSPYVPQVFDLNALVPETILSLRQAVSPRAEVQLQLATNVPDVSGDVSQVQHIITNLVMNASEALADSAGVIRLTTGTMYASRDYLASAVTASELPEGDYVYLDIMDTGCGMTPDVLARIFEPFFSTKFTGRGLGLAAVLGMLSQHHGALQVDSKPGAGSTFRLLLPRAARAQRAPAPAPASAGAPPREETDVILVVDDDLTVRALMCEIVKALGYAPLAAANGREALRLFQANRTHIKAVLLDILMPEMDGAETLYLLRQLSPALPALVVSGANRIDAMWQRSNEQDIPFLAKPFSVAQLKHTLRAMLS